MKMKNTEVAQIFWQIAIFLNIKGGEPFKVRAYQRAAQVIETLPVSIEKLVEQNELRGVSGIGDAIAKKITELVTTGHLRYYDDLRVQFPDGLFELLVIPGIGPKIADRLIRELGIKTVEQLEAAILDGRVAALSYFGDKTAEKILRGIRSRQTKEHSVLLGVALPIAEQIIRSMYSHLLSPGKLIITGSVRRGKEMVGDIDLIAVTDDAVSVMQSFTGLDEVAEVLVKEITKAIIITHQGVKIELQIVPRDSFGSFLQYSTGSKKHNSLLQEWGQEKGLQLSKSGITDVRTGKLEIFAREEDLYQRLGLQYIPPELREGRNEIVLAEQSRIPPLVELENIKGDMHLHTKWSDGRNSIEEMILAARAMGYEYIAITDHSRGLGLTNGLSEDRLRAQIAEIKRINREITGICILTGIEVDIRADSTLSLPDNVLSELDIVIASIHSGMDEDENRITQRIITAINNPHVDIIAHPTCRLLGRREPVRVNMEKVLHAARDNGVALEINAMPNRLDLSDDNVFRAREMGVKLVIGTDAHDVEHLSMMRYGVTVARRGWCEAQHIGNSRQDIREYLRRGILV